MRGYCTSPDNCTCDGVPIYRTLSAADVRLETRRLLNNRRDSLEEHEKLDREEARIPSSARTLARVSKSRARGMS